MNSTCLRNLCVVCASVLIMIVAGACGTADTLQSSVGGDGDSLIDPIDLTGDGDGTCEADFQVEGQDYGFDLPVIAVEAAGVELNDAAIYAGAWSFTSGGVEVTVVSQINATEFPPSLALLVATANAEITDAGGSVNAVVELVLPNGDAASQTNYLQDGVTSYRVDTVKNDSLYSVTVSVAEGDLTQTVDNAMIAVVTSLCVD